LKEYHTQKRKINPTMRAQERRNHSRKVDKQMRIRKEWNIRKITK
jgi:hypothetical protein